MYIKKGKEADTLFEKCYLEEIPEEYIYIKKYITLF